MRSWEFAVATATVLLGCGGSTGGAAPADGGAGASGSAGSGGSGATGGTSGTSGSAGTGGAPTEPGCASDADCTLIDDCCSCLAIAPGEAAPPCGGGECFATACSALGAGNVTAQCVAGRCVVSASCNKNHVTCKSMPSPCPAGRLHAVFNNCWGGCLAATECADVSGCSDCDSSKQTCVANEDLGGASYHCAALAPDCGTDRTCACFGPTVCVGGYSACNDKVNDGALHCNCPDC